jgi:cytochrome c oxidase cbb3-type subunit 3
MFKNRFSIAHWVKAILIVVISIGLGSNDAFAAGPPKASELSNPLAQVLLVIIVGLLLAIGLLANVILGAAQMYLQRFKDESKRSDAAGKTVAVILFCLVSTALFAADAPAADAVAAPAETTIAGLGLFSFYALITVIFLELLILLVLLGNLKKLLAKEAAPVESTPELASTQSTFSKWWDNLNQFRPIQEEANIDLGHNYDGIRELDNRLPPWWLYGFYLTIIFGCIYLYRYHIAESAPLSKEEFTISMEKAAIEKEAYLKKSANKVDENTVTYLSSTADLDAGKKIFTTVCVACHLADGGGSVGPNLTDKYWIHGGGIKDIFKTLKYGWPEKGMKSWKDDYTPQQLAQISAYVKSLGGTTPAKPKEPQGVLFEEKATNADSTKAVSDTTKITEVVKK